MLENRHCKCHICRVERHLFKSLTEPPASVRFSALALNSPALARFSNVSELLTDLHTKRNGDPGTSIAGERVSILLGHSSIKVTERHYSPWIRERQEQAEADVRRTWALDPIALLETKGTPEVHKNSEPVN
jgi:integrase